MSQNIESPSPSSSSEQPEKRSWSIQRITVLSASVLGGIIVLIFVIGLLLAIFADLEPTAARMEIIRNTLSIVVSLELLLIVFALAILVLQVVRLINLLQNKAKPVLESTQDAVSSAKGTVEFVGNNVTEPVVKAGAFMAGAGVFIREIGGIRRAINPSQNGNENGHEEAK